MLQPWFQEAKLGIFIHWGIYSAGGVGESWPMFNRQIPRQDYMAMIAKFTASKYDPRAWARLFRRAGARYVVRLGDTLYGISRKFAVSIDKLREWNRLSGSDVHQGQKLVLFLGREQDYGG